jgi:lipid-binding SYLF domain-containing protein
MATGSLRLGGNLSLAAGPLGRSAEASGSISSSGGVAAMFSYSKSKGLYAGELTS